MDLLNQLSMKFDTPVESLLSYYYSLWRPVEGSVFEPFMVLSVSLYRPLIRSLLPNPSIESSKSYLSVGSQSCVYTVLYHLHFQYLSLVLAEKKRFCSKSMARVREVRQKCCERWFISYTDMQTTFQQSALLLLLFTM